MRFRIIFSIFITTLVFLAILLGIRFGYLEKVIEFSKLPKQENKKVAVSKPVKNNTSLDSVLNQCFTSLEIPENHYKRRFSLEDSTLMINIQVPRGKPMEWIVWFITSSVTPTGYRVDDCFYYSEQKGCRLNFSSPKPDKPKLIISMKYSTAFFSQTASMAILIEDFGFSADETSVGFLSFPEPLTVALSSTKKLSTWTAQIANEYHKEIILMIPMEPLPRSSKYASSAIMVHYPEEKIHSILNTAIESVPHFAGFCNYYGERVLEDSRVMQIILSEVSKHKSYFVMTPGNRKSVAGSIAAKMNVPFREVDFTINSKLSTNAIQDTLSHFATIAQKRGQVLIKGTASASLITALKNALPALKQNGIRLIYVSETLKP